MLNRRDRISIRDMLDAAEKAVRLAERGSRADLYANDDPLPDALIRLITVVGEAAKRVSAEGRAELPGVRWSDAAGMRDFLVHDYHDVNLEIVWATVQDDLPVMIQELRDALAGLSDSER